MRRILTALVTTAALVASSSAVGAQQDEAGGSLVEQLIATADDSLGEDATVGVLRAYDRGYGLLQIIEALLDGSLAADGTITDEEGAAVAPVRAPSGVIAEDGSAAAAAYTGPVGGTSRAAGGSPISGEQIGIGLLERGIEKTSTRLDKKEDLGARAGDYDTSLDVFTMLTVIILMDLGYSPEQIILDGFIENRISIDIDGVSIRDEDGRLLRPDGVEPFTEDDPETVAQIETFVGGVFDAISGEDPLAAADDSFKRQYTLTIEIDVTDDEGFNGTIEGKVNFGARKGEPGRLSGRGTGSFTGSGACSLSDLDTTKHPYEVSAPLRIGVAGGSEGATATLGFGFAATTSVRVDAAGDSICLDVVRDTADSFPQLISVPEVEVRLRDGATANTDNQDSGQPFTVGVAVRVKEI